MASPRSSASRSRSNRCWTCPTRSDGTATIATGDATASGNESDTTVHQDAQGDIDGAGAIITTQAALVGNSGNAAANTGVNSATGNVSTARITAGQGNNAALSNNVGPLVALTGPITASNQASLANASDGTAEVHTGDASATGNRSGTHLSQDADAEVDGFGAVVTTQVAPVLNAGSAAANTGNNNATGNTSDQATTVNQLVARAASNNSGAATFVAPAILASHSASVTDASDGTASIRTGDARAVGNQSSTAVSQDADGSIDGAGLAVQTQVAPVVSYGTATANTGVNTAIGNAAQGPNDPLQQSVGAASLTAGGDPITVVAAGPIAATNQAEVDHTSDGTVEIRTGAAEARGNVSDTELAQVDPASVTGLGAVLHTQIAGGGQRRPGPGQQRQQHRHRQ